MLTFDSVCVLNHLTQLSNIVHRITKDMYLCMFEQTNRKIDDGTHIQLIPFDWIYSIFV
jgi:hypothetical protein